MQATIQNSDYDFTASTGVVSVLGEYKPVFNAENVKLIVNQTAGVIIYNPICGDGGTFVNNQVTVDYDTSAMSDNDVLWIQVSVEPIPGSTPTDPLFTKDETLSCLNDILAAQNETNVLLKILLS